MKQNKFFGVEKFSDTYMTVQMQIMGISSSGVYMTNGDFVTLGKKLGYEMDHKSREFLVKTLFTDCENDGKVEELFREIISIISARLVEYKRLGDNYPNARNKISQMFHKARATQMIIQRELNNIPQTKQVQE